MICRPKPNHCVLTDNLRPVTLRQGCEDTPIHSIRQLVDALHSFAAQKPRVLILTITGGPQLFVGMEGEWAAVEAYPAPATGRSWTARPGVA